MNDNVKSLINVMPSFYKNLVKSYLSTKHTQGPDKVKCWGNQGIWNNTCITNNGKVLHYINWIKRGALFISDFYDKDGKFLFDRIKHKFNNPGAIYFQYQILKKAILKACRGQKIYSSNDDTTCIMTGIPLSH